MTVAAAPHRERRAPVALARDRPVHVVLQPAAEAPVLDVLRVPRDGLVRRQQALAQLGGADEPGRLGVVEQRRAAAPAVRVGVQQRLRAQQPAVLPQPGDDVRVGVLDPAAGELAHAVVVGAVEPDRVDDLDPLLLAEPVVVLAEGERGVHDARAVVGGHEVGRQHPVTLRPQVLGGDVGKQRRVAGADHVLAVEAVGDLRVLAQHGVQARLGEHVAVGGADVRELGRDGERGVGEQRPRRRRPGEDAVALAQRAGRLHHREGHVDGGVLDVLVALRDLVRGQRGAATRAVGHDLVALEQQLAVPHLAQRPPDGLDVRRVQRAVRVLDVDPVAHPLRQRRPLLEELEHRLAALLVELGDAVALDVVLAGEAELLLDGDLHRQAVAVPAALALDVAPAHRLVAGEDVLEHAREHVVGAGAPVGGRRALVEHERLGALAAAQRLREDVALTPSLQHLLLHRGEGDVTGHGAVLSHWTGDSRCGVPARRAPRRRACGRARRACASRRRPGPRTSSPRARHARGTAGRRAPARGR
jgi:hypothetical protein